MSNTGLDNQAFKLLIGDIGRAEKVEDGVYQLKLSTQQHKTGTSSTTPESPSSSMTLSIKLTWIQGNIASINENPADGTKVLIISDGSGQALIYGCDTIPGADHKELTTGSYIGILGQILQTNPEVTLNAVKIMVLKDRPTLKHVWKDEVQDLKAFLLGQYDEAWKIN